MKPAGQRGHAAEEMFHMDNRRWKPSLVLVTLKRNLRIFLGHRSEVFMCLWLRWYCQQRFLFAAVNPGLYFFYITDSITIYYPNNYVNL